MRIERFDGRGVGRARWRARYRKLIKIFSNKEQVRVWPRSCAAAVPSVPVRPCGC